MIDAVKDYLAPKRFGIVAYVCVIVHFLCGLVFTAVTAALRASEIGKFSCIVDPKSTATYKTQVDKACFSRYDQAYNTPLPLYVFVLLSIGSTVLVSVIYSLVVSKRVDEIESSHERQIDGDGDAENHEHGENRRTVYVFHFYFVHLVLRSLCGIIFTVLQYTFFYPNGFDLKFSCDLPPAEVTSNSNINAPRNASQLNNTSVSCENLTASEKTVFGIIVFVMNVIFTLVILVEVIFLSRRLPILNCRSEVSWNCDIEFVNSYLLRKRYMNVPDELQLTSIDKNPQECINIYKQQILKLSRAPDINYIPKTTLDNLHVDVIIHTGRARHRFSKNMKRHEIYDVYMAVPSTSLRLEKIRDLFYPNKDTNGIVPRRILVIGRPGIGKTVLTEKIIRDWANGIDEYYCDKIALVFKFRWFNIDELTDLSLKTFLRIGTGNLSEENFESIYEEIRKEPQKAILIFDGLDEFNGNAISCLDQSQIIPNDPNTCMSGMNLFIKIIVGSFLQGATVLVTSRPTADDFYSRLDFDRNVEIIGFTSNKIEEYVSRFCDNNNRSDLVPKIWSHINSSSELLNLCYIPENCFIVCVTLSECLNDPGNDTGALPTTLTELYQTAIDHFEKHHHRNVDGNSTAEETLMKLQLISFRGMENGQLIFNQELFDAQMKKSSLVNSLSNPIFPVQTQFCFIHLTIQEFLAARHVTETLAPVDIKKFISDHVRRSKWHLVLQFIAGLLGKKMKMFDREYKDCVLVFVEGFEQIDDAIRLNYNHVFVMKCLREVDDENIAKDVCKTTAIKDVVKLYTDLHDNVSPSDWAAVTFVCKHMENLASFNLISMVSDCLQEILKLLQKKCIHQLRLRVLDRSRDVDVEHVFSTLMNMECTVNHTHTNLTSLTLNNFCMSDNVLSNIRLFFKNGHAGHLEILNLGANKISPSGISKLCEVLINEHFTELAYLDLSGNLVCDEGASVLCNTLIKGPRKLTKLKLFGCSLTDRCVPTLVKTLQDEHCKLTYLLLGGNGIGDDSVRSLCENALTKEHCKLTELHLGSCSLTDRCMSILCKALQDERCKLNVLSLSHNNIGNEGVCVLFEDALTKEYCKLTKLYLCKCLLTDQCIPTLCKALQDERCKLTILILENNNIGDEGVCELFEDILTKEHCKLTELNLNDCSLTDKCIPRLCKALQDERCRLTKLRLLLNKFTKNGKKILFDLNKYSGCKTIEID